jgi:hypothetical protein
MGKLMLRLRVKSAEKEKEDVICVLVDVTLKVCYKLSSNRMEEKWIRKVGRLSLVVR